MPKRHPPEVKAVVFDLYNTLITIRKVKHPYLLLFSQMNLGGDEYNHAVELALTSDHQKLSGLVAKIGSHPHIKLDEYEEMIQEELQNARMYTEVPEVLLKIKRQGYSLGLISNVATPYKEPFYRFGLDKYFDTVVFSSEIGLRKPNPMIYARTSDLLGVGIDELLMVGDSLTDDIMTPVDLGMRAVHLDRKGTSEFTPRINSLRQIQRFLDYP